MNRCMYLCQYTHPLRRDLGAVGKAGIAVHRRYFMELPSVPATEFHEVLGMWCYGVSRPFQRLTEVDTCSWWSPRAEHCKSRCDLFHKSRHSLEWRRGSDPGFASPRCKVSAKCSPANWSGASLPRRPFAHALTCVATPLAAPLGRMLARSSTIGVQTNTLHAETKHVEQEHGEKEDAFHSDGVGTRLPVKVTGRCHDEHGRRHGRLASVGDIGCGDEGTSMTRVCILQERLVWGFALHDAGCSS